MVAKKADHGAILAMVLLVISIMLLLLVTSNQDFVNQQRSVGNANDYALAQEYAKSAMLAAEATVYAYDQNSAIEQPPLPCSGGSSPAARRCVISQPGGSYNITDKGAFCNQGSARKGWCFSSARGSKQNYQPEPGYLPWLISNRQARPPCHSYSFGAVTGVPLIDDAASRFSVEFQSGDGSLCAQPRYMLEILNLNFIGRYGVVADSSQARDGEEQGSITQVNGARVIMSKNGSAVLPSARLYRVTVRAFGRNGNTRVTYQEYLAIENYQPAGRTPADTPSNAAYRIIPLSLRWLR